MTRNLTRIEAEARATLIRVHSYHIAFDLAEAQGGDVTSEYRSTTTIRFDASRPGTESFLDVEAKCLEHVELNGRSIDVSRYVGERLILSGLDQHNLLVVDARFRYGLDGGGLVRFVDPVDRATYLNSMAYPDNAPRMFGCFDQPDMKATFTIEARIPATAIAISNGREMSSSTAGEVTTVRFATTAPISTYLIAINVGPFHSVSNRYRGAAGDVPLGLFCRRSLAPYLEAEAFFNVTISGLSFYERVFDYPYPFDKYDQIVSPSAPPTGAMENVGAVSYGESFIYQSRVLDNDRQLRASIILHEMAHMWFGNLVTFRWWDDLWLNESFATFCEHFAQAETTHWRTAWAQFVHGWKIKAYEQDQQSTTHPVVTDTPDLESNSANGSWIIYGKGASALRQLAAYVGIDTFFAAISAHLKAHAFSSATLADLLDALGVASGRDIAGWAREWLLTAQANTLSAELSMMENDTIGELAIRQTAPPEHPTLRRHRVAIGLYHATEEGLRRRRRIEVEVVGSRTVIPGIARERRPELILINDDDLSYAKVRLDDRSLLTVSRQLSDITDPLARAACWAMCWDMVRDGELPVPTYVDLTGSALATERETSLLVGILETLKRTLVWYLPDAAAEEFRSRLAQIAWRTTTDSQPGSDQQLLAARAFSDLAGASGSSESLRALLSGSAVIEGLTLDLDLRWLMLRPLVASGQAVTVDIDAELQRAPGATSELHSVHARALLPTVEAKEKAWQLITGTHTATIDVRAAALAGFWHYAQAELLRPYVERYFALLDEFWVTHGGSDIAGWLLSYQMFPPVPELATLRAADEWLAETTRPAAQRRLVQARRDELARAIRIRQLAPAPRTQV